MNRYQATVAFQGIHRTRAPEDGFQPPGIKAAAQARATEKSPLASNESGAASEENKEKKVYKFDEEERWRRIVMNDIENVLIGIVMHWVAYIAQGNFTVTGISIVVFTVARIVHTICYLKQFQPWRSISWFIGVLANLTAAINVLVGVL